MVKVNFGAGFINPDPGQIAVRLERVSSPGGTPLTPFFAPQEFVIDNGAGTWEARGLTPGLYVARFRSLDLSPNGFPYTVGFVPFRIEGNSSTDGLEAFVCLGEKRSGDIYTHTDVLLLTALGKTMSSHMLRFDEAELLSRARAMQDKMRRYVPGAIAEAIASGTDLETGEREVSVLFVDMRGYTSFADTREAETIFSTVNRYTDAVSTIVNECGGVVVEFNGDGMMAVFGAPRPLADKERAAVATAKRLVETVPLLRQDDPNAPPMRVGVGVATGAAFVGNIEAADRTIWSAIGSTTNLAARLQSMTREYDAAMLIDSLTFERGVAEPQGFTMHENVKIRGRKRVETIFAYGSVPAGATTSTGA